MTIRSALALLILALPVQVLGQAGAPVEQLYRVELVVFAHEPGAAGASEDFLASPDADHERTLSEIDLAFTDRPDWLGAGMGRTEDSGVAVLQPIELPEYRQLLDVSQGELRTVFQRLQSRAGHRALMHVIWVQSALPDANPPVIDLGTALLASPEVTGTARLSRSRFLHLELDLEFLPTDRPQVRPMPVIRDGQTTVERRVPRYRLQESRRMRSQEMHYFDHPAFGVIATVTPLAAATLQDDNAR